MTGAFDGAYGGDFDSPWASHELPGGTLVTTFVSPTELTAVIPASMLASAVAFDITVDNPGAPASGSQTFTVTP